LIFTKIKPASYSRPGAKRQPGSRPTCAACLTGAGEAHGRHWPNGRAAEDYSGAPVDWSGEGQNWSRKKQQNALNLVLKLNSMGKAIDLRSDTVTRPDAGMLEAMMLARTGDDVLGDDPTVKELEARVAVFFGMESALFCPSGTMTNQLAIKLLTRPGDEVICHHYAHIYNYEGGGMSFNSGVQAKLVGAPNGHITPDQLLGAINPDDDHAARTALLAMENTSNKGGGICFPIADMARLSDLARERNLPVHLDGARVWNALVARGEEATSYGQHFDTISVCMSKGLGCPVGSLLLMPRQLEKEARRIRKKLGGGMRQAGILAAAGLYALEHRLPSLANDHEKAQMLAAGLRMCPWVEGVVAPETNIVIFNLKPGLAESDFMAYMAAQDIHLLKLGPGRLRFVTHFDVSDEDVRTVCQVLAAMPEK
jgi:threonine aldolase